MHVLLAALLVPLAFQEAPIEAAPGWTTRYPGREAGKDALVMAGGGSGATEAAIQLALQWLARHQSNDGSWGAAAFQARCGNRKCSEPGNPTFDVGTTGLALLAFLGAGQGVQSTATWTQSGARDQPLPFGPVVAKGLRWLLSKQEEAGCIGPQGEKHLYNHLIAAQAVGRRRR